MKEYICPSCGQPIHDEEALLCHFCGESLQRAGHGFLSRMRYANRRTLWYFLVFLALLGFGLLVVWQ